MSTERALEFIHDVAGDPKLCSSVARADRTLDAWVNTARDAGYSFEAEELKVIAEELLDEPTENGNVILRFTENFFGKDGSTLTTDAVERLKAVMQQGRYSGYYRPW